MARARARAQARGAILDLTLSNPTEAALEIDRDAILDALASREGLRYRPAPAGEARAREAVAAYYARREITVDPSQIILTASTSEAYAFLFKLLLDPGDRVLVPEPSYPLFGFLLDLADVRGTPYWLAYDGAWHLDKSRLDARDPRTRALLVVSPNNPTGTVLDLEERRALGDALGDRPVISDEVFADFAEVTHASASWIGAPDRLTFSLNGLSKSAGLPQLKLGWIVVGGPPELAREALARLELIADTYLSVATPVQLALPKILSLAEPWQAELRARLARNRACVERVLRGSPISVRRSQGGWSSMLDLPRTMTDEAWALRLLDEDQVLTHPGYFFDVEGGAVLVISLLLPTEVLEEGLTKLRRRVEAEA